MSLKKKMAQMNSNRNKFVEQRQEQTKREALLQQANALLVDMADAPVKKNKKKVNEEEHEAGLAELTIDTPTTSELSTQAPKPKPKKKAQDDELDRVLACCTVQRFACCSVPSNFSLCLSAPLQYVISSIDVCIASVSKTQSPAAEAAVQHSSDESAAVLSRCAGGALTFPLAPALVCGKRAQLVLMIAEAEMDAGRGLDASVLWPVSHWDWTPEIDSFLDLICSSSA